MRILPAGFLTLLLGAPLGGCQNGNDSTPPGVALVLEASVTTPTLAPVAGAYVTLQTWPESRLRPPPIDPLDRTDSLGRFLVQAGSFAESALDSLRLQWLPPGCFEPIHDTTLYHIPITHDTIRLQLLDTLAPLTATSAPGEYCGFGVSAVSGPGAFRLGLRVDSVIGTQLYGRWRLNYDWTQGDDYGPFVGGRSADVIELALTHAAPWGSCTGLRLGAALSSTGQWGPLLSLLPEGCVGEPLRFDMVKGHWFQSFP